MDGHCNTRRWARDRDARARACDACWFAALALSLLAAAGCTTSAPASAPASAPDAAVDAPVAIVQDAPAPCDIYANGGGAGIPSGVPRFETPEQLLSFSPVSAALAAIRSQPAGASFQTSTDSPAPDVAGTYSFPANGGKLVATSTGTLVGSNVNFAAFKLSTTPCSGLVQADTTANGVTTSELEYLRGSGQSFTMYAVGAAKCSVPGTDFTFVLAQILSGQIDRTGGTQSIDYTFIAIDTEGTLTPACANQVFVTQQTVGGWSLVHATGTLGP